MALSEIHFNNCILRIEILRSNRLALDLDIFTANLIRILKVD